MFVAGHLSGVAVGVAVVFVNVLSPPALPELHNLRLNLEDTRPSGKVFRDNDNNIVHQSMNFCPKAFSEVYNDIFILIITTYQICPA